MSISFRTQPSPDGLARAFTIGADFSRLHRRAGPIAGDLRLRGVGNSYQTLAPDTAYTYLVNDHWSPDAEYSFLNLADETANIDWPIPLSDVEISAKDLAHPRLADVTPIPPKKTLVLGANGQLGTALRAEYGDADARHLLA